MAYEPDYRTKQKFVSEQLSTHVSLIRYANLFFIETEINGDPHRLMLDFGAQGLVLDHNKFPDLKFYPIDFATINNQKIKGVRIYLENLHFNGITFSDVEGYTMPMTHAKKLNGFEFSGVLGVSVLEDFEIEVDLINQSLVMHAVDKQGQRINPYSQPNNISEGTYVMPFSYANNLLLLEADVAGKNLRFGLDTGAEVSVLDQRMNKKVKEHIQITSNVKATGASGSVRVVEAGQIPSLHFYDVVKVECLPAVVMPLQGIEASYGVLLDGLLGYDFFAKGKFTFNFKKRTVVLEPHEDQYFFCDVLS